MLLQTNNGSTRFRDKKAMDILCPDRPILKVCHRVGLFSFMEAAMRNKGQERCSELIGVEVSREKEEDLRYQAYAVKGFEQKYQEVQSRLRTMEVRRG